MQSAMKCAREEQNLKRQKVLTKAAGNWSKEFIRTANAGWAQVRKAACTGVKCDLIVNKRWGWECMFQLQKAEDRKTQQLQHADS
jgi:hypothetical protein